jgi:PAS domain S-box-containing protein
MAMKIRKPEIFFSLLCVAVGFAWILLSRIIPNGREFTDTQLHRIDQYADIVFVLIVSAVIYISIRFYHQRFRASEFKYRILFDTSPLPMWIFHIDSGRFLMVNKAMVQKYGYSQKELLAMSPIDIRPAEEVPRFLADVKKRSEGVQDVGIWTHRKKTGETFIVQVRANKITYKNKECFLVMADDISDVVAKENEIERLSLVARYTLNGIIITGKDRTIEWVNDAFVKMTGYSFDEAVGKIPTEMLHGTDTDKNVEAAMVKLISEGKSYSGELLNYRKDGSKMWVQTTVSPIEINDKANKYVAIFIDITERKKQEEMIRRQNDRLKDIAFASSHLIRAPLANILGLTDLLNETDIAANEEIVSHLRSSAHKLDEAIKEMVSQSNQFVGEQR